MHTKSTYKGRLVRVTSSSIGCLIKSLAEVQWHLPYQDLLSIRYINEDTYMPHEKPRWIANSRCQLLDSFQLGLLPKPLRDRYTYKDQHYLTL